MIEIRYIQEADREFWYTLDRHLPSKEFSRKVRDKEGYILTGREGPVGILRFNFFWDSIPFCTMLYVKTGQQGKGYGKALMQNWEKDMKAQGYGLLLTSTQVDETAQHFYRKLGYKDCGGLLMDIPGYSQPMELFLAKRIGSDGEET
ncbi:MAG TPA: GNAT family N-acetyltransferase [Candidatus Choladousia intestinigallinarum]|nr:GNAT family N-acetyltransferase [Candidatus Choladousia intestinigallinarum]